MLKHRLFSASIIISTLILVVMFSHGWTNIFLPTAIAAVASIGLLEFYYMLEQKGFNPLKKWGIIFSVLYIFVIYLVSIKSFLQVEDVALMPIYLAILTVTIIITFKQNIETSLTTLISTLAGFFYVTWLLSFILRIILWRGVEQMDGRFFFLFFVVVVKCTDIGAYFIGSWLGKHKLAPKISPKKTMEGSVGGAIFSTVLGAILACTLQSVHPVFAQVAEKILPGAGIWLVILLGGFAAFILSTLGQFGDLAESIWKRDAKVKDSGGYIPGMGGVLDVLDSLLFAAPLMYILMKIFESVI